MSHKPQIVSIVIPTFNRPELLKRAVESVLRQTYPHLEIIVIDDASTVDYSAIIEFLSDARIRYIKSAQNQGLAASRNHGLQIAQGDFVNFLDDDDELDPTKIEKQMSVFNFSPSNVGLVYCGYRYIYKNKIIATGKPKHRGYIFKHALDDSLTIVTHCALIRRDFILKVGGFDENLISAEDYDFWIRFAKVYHFDFVPEVLVSYHLHESGNMTKQLQKRIQVREIILEKYKNDFCKYKKALSAHLCRLGALYYMDNRRAKGIQHILRSIFICPLQWKGYVYFILIFMDIFKPGTLEYFGTLNYGKNRSYY